MLLVLGSGLAFPQAANDYLFAIRQSKKFGFINRSGTVVVPPRFDAAGYPHEGRISFYEGSRVGYIDFSGKLVVEPKYDNAGVEIRGPLLGLGASLC